MIKLLADKAEMEAIERAEKKELGNTDPEGVILSKPMSAVSQMSATVTAVEDDKSTDVPESSRYTGCMLM